MCRIGGADSGGEPGGPALPGPISGPLQLPHWYEYFTYCVFPGQRIPPPADSANSPPACLATESADRPLLIPADWLWRRLKGFRRRRGRHEGEGVRGLSHVMDNHVFSRYQKTGTQELS